METGLQKEKLYNFMINQLPSEFRVLSPHQKRITKDFFNQQIGSDDLIDVQVNNFKLFVQLPGFLSEILPLLNLKEHIQVDIRENAIKRYVEFINLYDSISPISNMSFPNKFKEIGLNKEFQRDFKDKGVEQLNDLFSKSAISVFHFRTNSELIKITKLNLAKQQLYKDTKLYEKIQSLNIPPFKSCYNDPNYVEAFKNREDSILNFLESIPSHLIQNRLASLTKNINDHIDNSSMLFDDLIKNIFKKYFLISVDDAEIYDKSNKILKIPNEPVIKKVKPELGELVTKLYRIRNEVPPNNSLSREEIFKGKYYSKKTKMKDIFNNAAGRNIRKNFIDTNSQRKWFYKK